MEMRCDVKIYEYQLKNGNFIISAAQLIHTDVNTSAKEIFNMVMDSKDNISNKFFTMIIESTINEPFDVSINFYTVRTNLSGAVQEINIIGPNNLDQEMLIDAIIGCKPTVKFWMNCKDKILEKVVVRPLSKFYPDSYDEDGFKWTDDAKDRLKKVNSIRLKEIYEKLRANQ